MRSSIAVMMVVVSMLCGACAVTPPPKPAEVNPREALSSLEGHWTVKGSEAAFLEKCAFYEGAQHMVCHSTNKGAKGTSKGISILTHSPTQGYLYFGIGSGGRAEALRGSYDAGIWTWRGEFVMDGKPAQSRVTMVPNAEGFHFKEELSRDGGPWNPEAEVFYIRKK